MEKTFPDPNPEAAFGDESLARPAAPVTVSVHEAVSPEHAAAIRQLQARRAELVAERGDDSDTDVPADAMREGEIAQINAQIEQLATEMGRRSSRLGGSN
jgi:hypothetical protein